MKLKKLTATLLTGALLFSCSIFANNTQVSACEVPTEQKLPITLSLARALPSWYGSCTQKGHYIDSWPIDSNRAGWYDMVYQCSCGKKSTMREAGKW